MDQIAYLLLAIFFILLAYLLAAIGGALDGEGYYPFGMGICFMGYVFSITVIFAVAAWLT